MMSCARLPRGIGPVDLVVLATPKDKKIVQLGVEYGLILRF